MQRKRRQNSENSLKIHRNSASNHSKNQHLDASDEKISQNEVKSGFKESEQNGDVSGTRSGFGLLKFCGVSISGVIKVVALMIIVPPFLNYASLQREIASLRPDGAMHDGPRGNKLFMNCSGRGLPVVMMDTPAGYSSDIWLLVKNKVAKFTKVCTYDRAGVGFSERATQRFHDNQHVNASMQDFKYEQLRPTTENMAADIHQLLQNVSSNTDKVLMVGGGLGALNARFYASFYENIFGIVLVNPFHEDMFTDKDWTMFWYDRFLPSLQMERILAALGITRLGIISGLYKPNILRKNQFDDKLLIRLKHFSCNFQHLSAKIMEHYYINESLAQLKILQKLKPFPKSISLSLISSKNFSDSLMPSLNQFWFHNQQLLAKELFALDEKVVVNSDFISVYFEQVDIIVNTVKKLVNKFRKSVKMSANM